MKTCISPALPFVFYGDLFLMMSIGKSSFQISFAFVRLDLVVFLSDLAISYYLLSSLAIEDPSQLI